MQRKRGHEEKEVKSAFSYRDEIYDKIKVGMARTCETVIGELSQFTAEGASSEEKQLQQRVRRIEYALIKSKRRT